MGRLGGYGGGCTVSDRWFVLEGAVLKSKPWALGGEMVACSKCGELFDLLLIGRS